eukprot:Filipodium_phascolosomae@DN6292_c0_g1_i1.p1
MDVFSFFSDIPLSSSDVVMSTPSDLQSGAPVRRLNGMIALYVILPILAIAIVGGIIGFILWRRKKQQGTSGTEGAESDPEAPPIDQTLPPMGNLGSHNYFNHHGGSKGVYGGDCGNDPCCVVYPPPQKGLKGGVLTTNHCIVNEEPVFMAQRSLTGDGADSGGSVPSEKPIRSTPFTIPSAVTSIAARKGPTGQDEDSTSDRWGAARIDRPSRANPKLTPHSVRR